MMKLIFALLAATSVTALRVAPGLEPEAKADACSMIHKPSEGQDYDYKLVLPNKLKANFAKVAKQESYSQAGQDLRLAKILPDNGFFVESGAHDGFSGSNSLHFEKKGWKGLLVEPNPDPFSRILGFHRKAYAFNGALSTTGESDMMNFDGSGQTFHLTKNGKQHVHVEPLHKLLTCLGQKTVDFWSLDVEGVEEPVLKAFPFKDIEVGVMLVEIVSNGAGHSKEGLSNLRQMMESKGFQTCGKVTVYDGQGHAQDLDQIFVNPNYFQKRGLETPQKC